MLSGAFLPTDPARLAATRRGFLTSMSGLLVASALPLAHGQDNKTDEFAERAETLPTRDNFRIAITYWPSQLKQDAGVLVLLHGLSGTQLDWGGMPKLLQQSNYAVITVDLRGHGQSKGNDVEAKGAKSKPKPKTGKAAIDAVNLRARDFQAMVLMDMAAVKQFILSEHQNRKLNMNRTAFIGAGMGADVALEAAAADWLKKPHSDGPVGNQTPRGQDVRAVVALSPNGSLGLPLPDAIKTLRTPLFQVAMMFGVGKKDKLDKGETKKLYEQAVSVPKNEDRMYLQEYPTPAQGTGMLGKGLQVELNISNFLKKHLDGIESEWRDRESKVGRKKGT